MCSCQTLSVVRAERSGRGRGRMRLAGGWGSLWIRACRARAGLNTCSRCGPGLQNNKSIHVEHEAGDGQVKTEMAIQTRVVALALAHSHLLSFFFLSSLHSSHPIHVSVSPSPTHKATQSVLSSSSSQ